MNCRKSRNLMGAYLYGDLSPAEMKLLRLHVETCSSCRADLETRGQAISALPDVVPELTDDDRRWIADSVRARLQKRPQHTVWYVPRFSAAFGVAAIVLAGVIMGSVLGQTTSRLMMASRPDAPEQALVVITRVTNAATPRAEVKPSSGNKAAANDPEQNSRNTSPNSDILNMLRGAPVLSTFTNRGISPRDPVGAGSQSRQTPGIVLDEKPGGDLPANEESSNKTPTATNEDPREQPSH